MLRRSSVKLYIQSIVLALTLIVRSNFSVIGHPHHKLGFTFVHAVSYDIMLSPSIRHALTGVQFGLAECQQKANFKFEKQQPCC